MKTTTKAILDQVCFPAKQVNGEHVATLEFSDDRTLETFAFTVKAAEGRAFAERLDDLEVGGDGVSLAFVDITVSWPDEGATEPEERELLRDLLAGLKACDTCGKPATKELPSNDILTCDACAKGVSQRIRLAKGDRPTDLPYARALRRALELTDDSNFPETP